MEPHRLLATIPPQWTNGLVLGFHEKVKPSTKLWSVQKVPG